MSARTEKSRIHYSEVMQMDPKSEAEVWSRVNAAARSADPEGVRERGPIGPELLEAMARAAETARELRLLSQRTGGDTGRTLRQLAAGMGNQEKQLRALYFFLTGTAPSPPAAGAREKTAERTVESLRRLMQGRELEAGRYEALAGRAAGECRNLLLELSREETQNFRTLLKLLRNCL